MRSSFFMRSSSLAIAQSHCERRGHMRLDDWSRVQPRSERIERPLFRALGLSRADAQQKSLGRRAVSADASFKLPGAAEPPRRTRVLQHRAQGSLLAPLSKCGEHSHPPSIERKTLSEVLLVGRRDNLSCQINFR